MALTRPTLLTIPSFDATEAKTFVFKVQSGESQIVANQLTVRKQSDNTVVYQNKVQSFKYEHILPANSLVNGEYYNAYVVVFDAQGNQSPPSPSIQFRCYSNPVIIFTNFPESSIIENASFNFKFNYTQAQGEQLSTYTLNLYNSNGQLISTSGLQYVNGTSSKFEGEYLFVGFEDNAIYSIQIVGTTVNGAIVESELRKFTILYKRPNIFTSMELKNNCEKGYISVKSNLTAIDGQSNPFPPKYIENKEVDLTQENSYVKWNEGFAVSGDFLARIWFRKPTPQKEIIRFSNASGQIISVGYMQGYENIQAQEQKSYLNLSVTSFKGASYYIISNYTEIQPETNYYTCYLKRIGEFYEIELLV